MCSPEVVIYPVVITRRDNFSAFCSPKYNRKHRDPDYEELIEKTWCGRRQENPSLYDGFKFRLHSWQVTPSVDGGSGKSKIHLNLGLTSYREFLGTNCAVSSNCLEDPLTREYVADPLGVGGIVETVDGCFVCVKRSQWCGEYPGLFDVPGGHPEPEKLLNLSSESEENDLKLERIASTSIVNEIYESIVREIVDEVNIPKNRLGEPIFLGFTRNNLTAGRPGAQFYFKSSLSTIDVRSLYEKGTQEEADESTEISFLYRDKTHNNNSIKCYWHKLTPSAKGAFMLLDQHLMTSQ